MHARHYKHNTLFKNINEALFWRPTLAASSILPAQHAEPGGDPPYTVGGSPFMILLAVVMGATKVYIYHAAQIGRVSQLENCAAAAVAAVAQEVTC